MTLKVEHQNVWKKFHEALDTLQKDVEARSKKRSNRKGTRLRAEFKDVQHAFAAFKKSSRPDAEINALGQILDVSKRALDHLIPEQPSGRKVKAKGAKKKAA